MGHFGCEDVTSSTQAKREQQRQQDQIRFDLAVAHRLTAEYRIAETVWTCVTRNAVGLSIIGGMKKNLFLAAALSV